MRLAVGTLREAKLAAVRRALARLEERGWPGGGVTVVPVAAASGVSEMPLSEEEGVAGARNRARSALRATGAELALGLEGGVAILAAQPPVVLLRNWAAAWDGSRLSIGCGPGIQLPRELAEAVLAGEELGDAIDRYARGRDIRSGRGTFGVLTADVVDRADAFAAAVLAALAPWYAGRI